MPCAETERRLHAYFDGELDALGAAAFEDHLETCAECRAALGGLQALRSALRAELPCDRAPAALTARITAALDRETSAPARAGRAGGPARGRSAQSFGRGLLTGAGGALLAAALAFFLIAPHAISPREALLDDLVNAHVRSLLPAHLVDVESTDRPSFPAAEGRGWKYSGRVKLCPMREDPITWPSFDRRLPSALSLKSNWQSPVTTPG
jgi:anti-sigma factor (TIGR02949 family)